MTAWLAKYQHDFSAQIKQARLPHAILLSGVQGSGKQALANWLASYLLCQELINGGSAPCGACKSCRLKRNSTHPDFIEVSAESTSISVEQIRALSHFFETKTHIAQHQLAIVHHAEKMTVAAANALLKTLEEPNDNSFIVLTSKDEQLMLPTILSRCQVVKLRANLEQSEQYLESHSGVFTNLTHLPEMSEQEVNDDYRKLEQQFFTFLSDTSTASILIGLLSANEHGWRMLEKLIANIARHGQNWYSDSGFDLVIDTKLLTKLYGIFLKINQTRMRLPQANQQLLFEKLIFEFAQLIEKKA